MKDKKKMKKFMTTVAGIIVGNILLIFKVNLKNNANLKFGLFSLK